MKILWTGLADLKYYEYIAKYCLPSWIDLPGDKKIIHDANEIKIKNIEVLEWNNIPNMNSNFLKHDHSKKVSNFWRKMQSQVWTVKKFKSQYDFIALLDTDIEVHNFDTDMFQEKMNEFVASGLPWMTGESQLRKLDAGFIVFNTKHTLIDQLISDYENIWESWKIFELKKPYDGDAVDSMFSQYPSFKMKNRDQGRGLHTYDIGLIHFGSKIPKELRANWGEDEKLILSDLLEQHKKVLSTL